VDEAGDIVVAGSFLDSISFGGQLLNSAGDLDIYLAKLHGDSGAHTWSRSMGGANGDAANTVAIDLNGDIVAAGNFAGTVDFGAGEGAELQSAGNYDVWLGKYTASSGAYVFAERYGSPSNDFGIDLGLTDQGDMFLVGSFQGTVNFGGQQDLVASPGTNAVFVARFSIAGTHAWSKGFEGAMIAQSANGVSVDLEENIAVTGSFCGTVNLGGADLVAASDCATQGADAYVARFDGATGGHLGSVRFGGMGNEAGHAIVQGIDRAIYSVGRFGGQSEFGAGALTSEGFLDGYVIALPPLD
jgi:hypothetical protein